MTPEMRKAISKELLEHTDMTKEQYIQACLLAEELDLELVSPEEDKTEQQEFAEIFGE